MPAPKRSRKPLVPRPAGPVRRVVVTRTGPPVGLAVLGLAGLVAVGTGGWWLLQPPPGKPDAEEIVDSPFPDESAAPAPAVVASAVPGPAVLPAPAPAEEPEMPAAEPAGPGVAPVLFEKLIALDSMGGAKKENLAWMEESWQLALKSGQWEDYRDLLGRSLQALAARQTDTPAVMAGKYSGPALVRHAFLTLLDEPLLQSLLKGPKTDAFVRWLLETPDAMQAFTLQVKPQDDLRKGLTLWASIAEEDSAAREAYRELAIAVSLVFDHEVRARDNGYGGEQIDAFVRYAHFKNNSEAGKLTGKIKTMSAADLVWVVGVPVTQSELDWALKEADFRRKTWGAAYQSIKYDMDKAVTGKGSYDAYTFAEIRKKGGICGDQSYFCAWTACAHGIPAAILGGDGSRGPHAWIMWMPDEGEWKQSGRLGGYPPGHTRSPQTGETVSEEEFLRLSDRKASSPERIVKAHQSLWMAQVFSSQPDRAAAFIAEAVKSAPRLAEPSAALLAHWMQHHAADTVDAWKDLLGDLRKNFRDSAALMSVTTRAEEEFVFARQDAKETMKNLRREAKKVDDTTSGDAGLAADLDRLRAGFSRQADVMKKAGNPDAIRTLYRRALGDYGNEAATFKALARDYFDYVKDDTGLAVKACHDLESACRRNVGRGKGDWFDVISQNSAWRVVADCYRAAGDTKKADAIVRDCDSREKTAKKKAV